MISKEHNIPPLNGLVLAGGKSTRMGENKAQIKWHGSEQQYHAADMLNEFCEEVYISCKTEEEKHIDKSYSCLPDTFLNMGPLGGILSALRSQRDRAWLVVACDLPLLNSETIEFLVSSRSAQLIATTFESPHDGLPEPLITIWEPSSYLTLLEFLALGVTCPRKVLMNAATDILTPLYPETLMNVNTPDDARKAKEILNNRTK